MRKNQRILIEYAALTLVALTGILLGSLHPVMDLPKAHPATDLYSPAGIFVSNLLFILAILLGSALSGGAVGVIALFMNTVLYGRFLSIYSHASFWTAVFPWLETVALVIAIQIGGDLFWGIWRHWPLRFNVHAALFGASITLLVIAAYIEGGLLHV